MLVDDIMNKEPHVVPPDAAVQTVAELMRDYGIGAIIVAINQRPLGIVTDRDLTLRVLGAGLPGETPVRSVMSRGTVCCAPGDAVEEALRVMRVHQIRRTPVTQSGRLVGIVSLCDIATKAMKLRDVEMTFADLCERGTRKESSSSDHRKLESRHI